MTAVNQNLEHWAGNSKLIKIKLVNPDDGSPIVLTTTAGTTTRWWGPRFAHCGGSAGVLARLSAEYAMPGVVGVGLVHCSLSAEMKVMIRS
jgi:hypothetical protein